MPLISEVTAAVDASGQKRRGFVAPPPPPYVLLPPPPSQPGLMLWIATFYRTHSLSPSFLLFFCTHFSSSSPSHCIRMSYEARSSSSEGRESKSGLFLFAFFLKESLGAFFWKKEKNMQAMETWSFFVNFVSLEKSRVIATVCQKVVGKQKYSTRKTFQISSASATAILCSSFHPPPILVSGRASKILLFQSHEGTERERKKKNRE